MHTCMFEFNLFFNLQMEQWGKFEAVHDIEKFNQEAAVSAGVLFYQLSPDTNDILDT